MRCGVIAKKLGMTRIWAEDGSKQPVTVLHMDNVRVTSLRTMDRDGYIAVQLGSGIRKAKHTSKPLQGHYAKLEIEPAKHVAEFRVEADNMLNVGDELGANHFVVGQMVDVSATSVGKGFAGAMKRHGFGGLRASHGVSVSHRSHGSTGQNQDPGRVFKGKKMAGHMGARSTTTQNLEIVEVDAEKGLVFVLGAVPGPKNGWVHICDAVKKPAFDGIPLPAGLKKDAEQKADEAESNDAGAAS